MRADITYTTNAKGYAQRVRAALREAVQYTGQQVRVAEQDEMRTVFDRPTPFTINRVQTERRDDGMTVAVGLARSSGQRDAYLNPQIDGGGRPWKQFEKLLQRAGVMPKGYYAIPAAGARFDSYGNMSRGQVVQILSWFQGFYGSNARNNTSAASRAKRKKGTRNKAGTEYIAITYQRGGLRAGIYEARNYSLGRAVRPVLIYVRRVSYKPRFRFREVAVATIERLLSANIERAMSKRFGGQR